MYRVAARCSNGVRVARAANVTAAQSHYFSTHSSVRFHYNRQLSQSQKDNNTIGDVKTKESIPNASGDDHADILNDFLQSDAEANKDRDLEDYFANFNLGTKSGSASDILLETISGESKGIPNLDLFNTDEKNGDHQNEVSVEDLDSSYIHEERETMLNIFNKYLGGESQNNNIASESNDLDKISLASSLSSSQIRKDDASKSKTDIINDIIQSYFEDDGKQSTSQNKHSQQKLHPFQSETKDTFRRKEATSFTAGLGSYTQTMKPSDFSKELEERLSRSLAPSIDYIDNKLSLYESYNFFETLKKRWLEIEQSENKDDFYLRDILSNSDESNDLRDATVKKVHQKSTDDPKNPELNIITLPIIFNKLLRNIAVKYQDPQLSLTLFNLLKDDLNFYTICCNQQTYNEVIRINWIFYGKSSLYAVEMIILEMINNGFNGDLVTFNLLEKIIIDYHNMKMGIDLNNELQRTTSIWNKEDDKRVELLERKLYEMGNRLR